MHSIYLVVNNVCSFPVFANSLLSLTLPWAYSRGARCHPSGRKPPAPVPPPPPRRHSDPTAPAPHRPKTRRYSDINNPKSKLDLRQELINLNLNNQEVDSWLGSKFDEKEEEPYLEKFSHDIPLQRSLSLDGGIEIFNYLQTIGSDWSVESNASSWTVHSYGRDSRTIEQYRSFEDIPASPRVKSRRASFDLDKDNMFFGSGLAVSVLKDSYKGFDSTGNISPQIRKLQKNFSFHDSLQDFKTAVNVNDDEKIGNDVQTDNEKIEGLEEVRQPMYRNISVVQTNNDDNKEVNHSPRQRKLGIPLHRNLSFDGLKKPEVNLRKEILKQTLPDFKSCENLLLQNNPKISCRESTDNAQKAVPLRLTLLKDSYQGLESGNANISLNIRRLKKNLSFVSPVDARDDAPKNVIPDVDRRKNDAKYEIVSTNTSNVVDISRNCDCRICSEEEREDRRSIWRRIFCKLFMKTVSTDDRKAYWDENNNLDEGQMYKCVLHTLKLLFGLWLRHLDHK